MAREFTRASAEFNGPEIRLRRIDGHTNRLFVERIDGPIVLSAFSLKLGESPPQLLMTAFPNTLVAALRSPHEPNESRLSTTR
jgi:hypothetical protein